MQAVEKKSIILAAREVTGILGICQLKRIWSWVRLTALGLNPDKRNEDHLDYLVINAVGLGYEQTFNYLYRAAPTFEQFEQWIIETTGGVSQDQLARINAAVLESEYPPSVKTKIELLETAEPVLSQHDLDFWNEYGYVILHNAVPKENCDQTVQFILTEIGADLNDPDTWYKPNDHGIMLQIFQNPILTANRESQRIHKAFAQLWRTADLWVSTDRCGFNVPERPGWILRGPDLHWDVSIKLPVPFGTQGILYLTDTPAKQGAFTCVPGFHHRIDAWVKSLPEGTNPRQQDLHALGSIPIRGKAGDLIIWHQALPHGSRPNRGTKPRIVQYINMYPTKIKVQDTWI